jgi:hypothetical protein
MLLSPAAYLERAIECDRLATAALKPKLRIQHSSWAAYYRFMAEQVEIVEPCRQPISNTELQANAP